MDAAFVHGFLDELEKIGAMQRQQRSLLSRGLGGLGSGVGSAGMWGLKTLGPAALLGGVLAAPLVRAGVQGMTAGLREPATGYQMPYQQ